MEYRKIRLLTLIFSFVTLWNQASHGADETFLGKLHAQEEKEYKELTTNIRTMSDADYAVFLSDRVDKAYAGKTGKLPAIIVVDVTEEMKQPEPNFLVNLLGLAPEEKDYGINKIESILTASDLNKSGGANLSLKDQYQSKDKLNYFQHLEGLFTQQEAKVLVSQPAINDFHVMDIANRTANFFVTTHTPTGRVIPRKGIKKYDMNFINAGLYGELLSQFEKSKVVLIRVGFHRPEDIEFVVPTKETLESRKRNVDDFISKWQDYEFEVVRKSEFHIYMRTTKPHVEAMNTDPRVEVIQRGNDLFSQMVRP